MASSNALVIGIGNPYRHDDGFGPAVIALLREQGVEEVRLVENRGDTPALVEMWDRAPIAVVIDALRVANPRPGTVHRIDADRVAILASTAGSHGLGFGEAVDLAATLGRAPDRLVIYSVEGTYCREFTSGARGANPA